MAVGVMARRMLHQRAGDAMSFKIPVALLLAVSLPMSACVGETKTASRTPDDALHNGTPEGDHTGSDPSQPNDDGDKVSEPPPGPSLPGPGPGWSGSRQDPPTPPTGGAEGPNGASPGGSAGPNGAVPGSSAGPAAR